MKVNLGANCAFALSSAAHKSCRSRFATRPPKARPLEGRLRSASSQLVYATHQRVNFPVPPTPLQIRGKPPALPSCFPTFTTQHTVPKNNCATFRNSPCSDASSSRSTRLSFRHPPCSLRRRAVHLCTVCFRAHHRCAPSTSNPSRIYLPGLYSFSESLHLRSQRTAPERAARCYYAANSRPFLV